MWILCGGLSIMFLALNWVLSFKNSEKRNWAMAFSLAFTSLTLLIEYQIASEWVVKEDWSALLDVVPYMFSILLLYVIIMTLLNVIPLFFIYRDK